MNQDQIKSDEENTKKSRKKPIIISIILLLIIIVVVSTIYFLIEKNNASGQVDNFKLAVENNEYKEISNILSNNENKISETQAQYFVEYIKKPQNKQKFNTEINKIKQNIKDDKQYNTNLGAIKDSKNHPIITIKKDGKKYFFLDKVTFKPNLFDVYIKEYNNTGMYEYDIGEKVKTSTDKNTLSSVGKFFVGRYSIDTEKTVENELLSGKVKGQLLIDTDQRDKDNKIVIEDVSDQSWFRVAIDNKQDLESSSIKLNINNKETDYDPQKIYGKYANPNKITLYATGKVENKKFKTKPINIESNHNKKPQNVTIAFDKVEISDYKKDTKELKDNAKSFMVDYMKDLNKAYRKSDYDKVSKYIDSNSKLEKQVKSLVESKDKVRYYQPKFIKLTREDKQLKIIMVKQLKDREVKSEYTLKSNGKKDDFSIIDYKDL